jgi:hypothetical protein
VLPSNGLDFPQASVLTVKGDIGMRDSRDRRIHGEEQEFDCSVLPMDGLQVAGAVGKTGGMVVCGHDVKCEFWMRGLVH